jgi:hypothetical protein
MFVTPLCPPALFSGNYNNQNRLQRPFASHYSPAFLLYEFTNVFLNFYRIFGKLGMVTSMPSIINAFLLAISFFVIRLLWGTYQTVALCRDIYAAYTMDLSPEMVQMKFETSEKGFPRSTVPLWLVLWTMAANGVLCGLNFFWFGKIVGTLRQKLFRKKAA